MTHRRSPLGLAAADSVRTWIRQQPWVTTCPAWPVPIQTWIISAGLGLTIRWFPPDLPIPAALHGMTLNSPDDDLHYTMWINPNDSPLVQRFTLAHEFSHVLLGHLMANGPPAFSTILEVEANTAAAELLLPWPLLAPRLPHRPMTTPTAWARWWTAHGQGIVRQAEVSPAVLYYHCIDLGYLDANIPLRPSRASPTFAALP
jgi:hypothetical protein